jgi:hypothetical protein
MHIHGQRLSTLLTQRHFLWMCIAGETVWPLLSAMRSVEWELARIWVAMLVCFLLMDAVWYRRVLPRCQLRGVWPCVFMHLSWIGSKVLVYSTIGLAALPSVRAFFGHLLVMPLFFTVGRALCLAAWALVMERMIRRGADRVDNRVEDRRRRVR